MATNGFANALQSLIELDQDLGQHEHVPADWLQWAQAQPFLDLVSSTAHLPPANSRSHIALGLAVCWARQIEIETPVSSLWKQATHPFWWAVAVCSLRDWTLWTQSKHPIATVLEHLTLVGHSFGETVPEALTPFLAQLHEACKAVAHAALEQPEQLLPALKRCNDLLKQFRDKQRVNDQTLLTEDQKQRRTTTAHSAVTQVIRRSIWGHPVPALLVDFLDTVWRRYLYMLFLKQGMEGPEWASAMRVVERLIWLAGEATAEEVQQSIALEYPQLRQLLVEGVSQLHPQEAGDPDFFLDLDMLMQARARNAPDAGLPLGELAFDEEAEEELGSQREPSKLILQLAAGDYLDRRVDGHWQRLRLLEVDRSHDLYLFADAMGHKALGCKRNELSAIAAQDDLRGVVLVHARQIPPVFLTHYFDAALELARQKLRHLNEKQKREQAAQVANQLEEHRRKEAGERAQRIAQSRAEAEEARRVQEARAQLMKLRPGALLQLKLQGQSKPVHLALIDNKTQQFIFVDRQGQRVAALNGDELTQKFLAAELEVLDSGSALDSTLRGLVRGRREFLKEQDSE